MRIIPAIDIIDGKAVRLVKGDYNKKTIYNDDPVAVARSFEDAGLEYLHVVDLDGAKSLKVINTETIADITASTSLKIDFGGGIKSRNDLDQVLDRGVAQVTCGSLAVTDRILVSSWLQEFGPERIILGADVRDKKIATRGWLDQTSVTIDELLSYYATHNLSYAIVTDIHKDGMGQGPSFELYEELIKAFPSIKFVASGGVHSLEDLDRLRKLGLDGAIIGKAIYEEDISLTELAAYVS